MAAQNDNRLTKKFLVAIERRPPILSLAEDRCLQRGLAEVALHYFATSTARLSRITVTFTWPGYSS